MNQNYPFTLMPLPYPYNLLEPYIDTQTMHLHHDRHMKAYVEKLNELLAPYPAYQSWSLTQLVTNYNRLPSAIREDVKNNAGGVYNHMFYFSNMTLPRQQQPEGAFKEALEQKFGSIDDWKAAMKQAGMKRFGSGYAWLVKDKSKNLKIISTANQDTPLTQGLTPLMCIDVWEHAYYLKYKNMRDHYIGYWWNVANYAFAAERWAKS